MGQLVDVESRVKGVACLRVVGAKIVPTPISAHYMVMVCMRSQSRWLRSSLVMIRFALGEKEGMLRQTGPKNEVTTKVRELRKASSSLHTPWLIVPGFSSSR